MQNNKFLALIMKKKWKEAIIAISVRSKRNYNYGVEDTKPPKTNDAMLTLR